MKERIEIPIQVSMQEDQFNANMKSSDDMNADFGSTTKIETSDYNKLSNKPRINEVELEGNKTFEDLGDTPLTNKEIKQIFDRVFGG